MAAEKKHVELEVAGQDKPLAFDVSLEDYQRFKGLLMRSPVQATNNFLLDTSTERERLKALLADDWGLPDALITPLVEAVAPIAGIAVKKL
jgi:hypothetical protein